MKFSKTIVSLVVLLAISSCSMWKDKKKSTSIEGSKIFVVNSTVGQFFFVAAGQEKVENGYKFDFIIGNKSYAQYEGLSLKVRWGKNKVSKRRGKKAQISAKDLKSEDVKIEVLKAGEWREFSLVIPAKDESELEILNLVVSSVDAVTLKDSTDSD